MISPISNSILTREIMPLTFTTTTKKKEGGKGERRRGTLTA